MNAMIPRFYLPCLFLLSLLFVHQCSSVDKQWIPNTNWENSSNWDKNRVPCAGDHVYVGSENSTFSIAMKRSTTITTLNLPVTGEMIFYNDIEIVFKGDSESTENSLCPDTGDIHFIRSSARNWYDLNNWLQIGPTVANASNEIVAHMDRIPCQHDSVIFPQESSFIVESQHPVTVASILLNGKKQSKESFAAYYRSESGRKQFKFHQAVDVTGEQCTDPTGCSCGTKFKETVCSFVKCDRIDCEWPLLPEGGCCSICGAILDVTFTRGFIITDFKKRLLQITTEENPRVKISVYRKENDSKVEVAFVDFVNGAETAKDLASAVKERLLSDNNFKAVTRVELSSSGSTEVKISAEKGFSIIKVVAIAAGVPFLAVCIILISVLLWRKNRQTRLENRVQDRSFVLMEDFKMGEIGQQPNVIPHEENQAGQASENPLYDVTESTKVPHSVANPLYEDAIVLN